MKSLRKNNTNLKILQRYYKKIHFTLSEEKSRQNEKVFCHWRIFLPVIFFTDNYFFRKTSFFPTNFCRRFFLPTKFYAELFFFRKGNRNWRFQYINKLNFNVQYVYRRKTCFIRFKEEHVIKKNYMVLIDNFIKHQTKVFIHFITN